jgi:hypothetical protein
LIKKEGSVSSPRGEDRDNITQHVSAKLHMFLSAVASRAGRSTRIESMDYLNDSRVESRDHRSSTMGDHVHFYFHRVEAESSWSRSEAFQPQSQP